VGQSSTASEAGAVPTTATSNNNTEDTANLSDDLNYEGVDASINAAIELQGSSAVLPEVHVVTGRFYLNKNSWAH